MVATLGDVIGWCQAWPDSFVVEQSDDGAASADVWVRHRLGWYRLSLSGPDLATASHEAETYLSLSFAFGHMDDVSIPATDPVLANILARPEILNQIVNLVEYHPISTLDAQHFYRVVQSYCEAVIQLMTKVFGHPVHPKHLNARSTVEPPVGPQRPSYQPRSRVSRMINLGVRLAGDLTKE